MQNNQAPSIMYRATGALMAVIWLSLNACAPGPTSTTTTQFRDSTLIIKSYDDQPPSVQIGDAQRKPTALDKLNEAASKGDIHAHRLLGHAYWQGSSSSINGVNVFPRNRESAVWYYERAAQMGDAPSQYYLGIALELGDGIAKNEMQAVQWHRKAAQQGHIGAHAQLGYFLSTGAGGVTVDQAKAVEHIRFAAGAGDRTAQLNLGTFYATGNGVERSTEQAAHWYWRAADQGNSEAMVRLARLLRAGDGVPRDEAAAREWLERAADDGHEEAQAMLAAATGESGGTADDPWAQDDPEGDPWVATPTDPWAEQDGEGTR